MHDGENRGLDSQKPSQAGPILGLGDFKKTKMSLPEGPHHLVRETHQEMIKM